MRAAATHLRNHLFEVLGQVQKGEPVTIELHGQAIGQIIPFKRTNRREKVTVKAKSKSGKIRQVFAPLDGVWRHHLQKI